MPAPRNPAFDQDDPPAAECLGLFGIDLEVKIQFRRSGYQALQGVTCEFHEGTARIRGHLPTFYLKQMAQEIVCAVVGVRSVVNQIEVGPDELPTRRPALSQTKAIGPMRPDVSLEGKLLANSSKYEGVGNHACSQPQNERIGHHRRRHPRDGRGCPGKPGSPRIRGAERGQNLPGGIVRQ